MTWDQISDYLSGKLIDPEAHDLSDGYDHLRKMPPAVEPEPVLDHLDAPEASTAISNSADFEPVKVLPSEIHIATSDLVVNEKAVEILEAAVGKSKHETYLVELARIDKERAELLAQCEAQEPSKRAKRHSYDVSELDVGDSIVYEGILTSARVMASLKGKSFDGKRKFKALEENGEIRIVRIN
jgi:hypothetical protein